MRQNSKDSTIERNLIRDCQHKCQEYEHANTGEISSGKIFVVSLEDAVRIRTGESGDAGLL